MAGGAKRNPPITLTHGTAGCAALHPPYDFEGWPVTLRIEDLAERCLVPPERLDELRRVAENFTVALTEDVAGLIDPADPNDPIAAQFVPSGAELETAP